MNAPRLHTPAPTRLLLCAATLLALSACTSPDNDRATDSATDSATDPAGTPSSNTTPTQDPTTDPTTDPTVDPTAKPAPPQLIDYTTRGSGSAEVLTRDDANTNLDGAPDSFKEFIGTTAEQLAEDGAPCEDGYVGVNVKTLRTDGYATGAVNKCGGYVALWAIVDGNWEQIDDTQDLWDCAALTKHQVPSDIAGDSCFDRTTKKQQPYQQP